MAITRERAKELGFFIGDPPKDEELFTKRSYYNPDTKKVYFGLGFSSEQFNEVMLARDITIVFN